MKGRKGTKESERGSRKERKAEAGFSEKQEGQLCEDSNTEHFSGCLSKNQHPLKERKRSATCITLHVQELWVGMTFSDTLLAVRNRVLSWAEGFGSKSAAHVTKIMTMILLGCRFLEVKAHRWHICVPRCLSCLIQRSFINICYSNEWAKIVYNSAISSCPPEGLK